MRTHNTQKEYKILLIILLLLSALQPVTAQSVYQPYSYQFYQKFSSDLYSTKTRIHSTIKPYFVDDSLLKHTYDSLMNVGVDNSRKDWAGRKLYNEHLIDVKRSDYTIYADVLPELQIGHDFSNVRSTWLTTLGAQVGGTIGSKFFFYASLYDNRASLSNYVNDYINNIGYIPGQGIDRSNGKNIKNWLYSTALFSYTPVKYVNFTIGKDKAFIGDGYRSMLLSDFASNYPFFKITATLGNVRYMAMYAYMNTPRDLSSPFIDNTRRKWGYFQYADWNVSNRVSIGLFQNVMEVTSDPKGRRRGFDFTFATPFVFMKPLDNSENDPAKAILGLTAKYKVLNKAIIYGQFALNEFHATDFFSGNGSVVNKSGFQLGIRGADLFHVKSFNYLAEFNTARPYTYASFDPTSNYSHNDQPLAHPFGAGFREWVGILNYSVGRFDFQGQLNYAYYGLDINGLDYGKDIFKSYLNAAKSLGNYVGQGLRTDFYYAEGKVAYILNPKYNLRLEIGALYRNEKNSQFNNQTGLLTIGLRSSFRNIYSDF